MKRDEPMAAAIRVKNPAGTQGPRVIETGKKAANQQPRQQPADGAVAGLEMILSLEERFRSAKSPDEIAYLAANDVRKLTGTRQTFVLQANRNGRFKVKTVSSLATIERDAPLIRWVERLVSTMRKDNSASSDVEFSLPAYCDENAEETAAYPFKYFHWQPITLGDGTEFAGLLQARERPFTKSDKQLTSRLASALGHAWRALKSDRRLRPGRHRNRAIWATIALLIIVAGAIPVPMTTIAPIEIKAKDPFVIAAPIDGVIDTVTQPPNSHVSKGDTLFRFEDTTFRNKAKLASREVEVASATYHKTRQAAFTDNDARYQLAITRSQHALKQAELTYAKELLAQTRVTAPVSGVVIYSDKSELEGHPVATGEAIMKIADPQKVQIQIELPVADAIVLKENADVRVFLDADPLRALDARIIKGSYQAQPQPSGQLAYELTAEFTGKPESTPRIGAHGTAQVFGDTTSLAFFLLRRPIAAMRQTFGF